MAFFPQMLAALVPQLMGGGAAGMAGGLPGLLGGAAGGGLPAKAAGAALPGLVGGGGKPMGPPPGVLDTSARPEPQGDGFFNNFFSTLDGNLESPSKLLALGLLNRQDPRLGAAGLLGMGLLGRGQRR